MLGLYLLFFIITGALSLPESALPEPNRRDSAKGVAPTLYPVSNIVSLGDSYSSNPGAGEPLTGSGDKNCSRFSKAWPKQLIDRKIFVLEDPSMENPNLQFYACAGATTRDIDQQISKMTGLEEMTLLTLGGNDVGFSGIVRSCIYGVYGSKTKLTKDAGPCRRATEYAVAKMGTEELRTGLENAVYGIFKKAPKTNLYWMSYVKFFEEKSNYCSKICFRPLPRCPDYLKITEKLRTELNNLAYTLDSIIKNVVKDLNPKVEGSITYIEVSSNFEGHRFCEKGVTDPKKPDRTTWFYFLTREKPHYRRGLESPASHNTNDTSYQDMQHFKKFLFKESAQLRAFHPTEQGASIYADKLFEAYDGTGS